MDERKRYGPNSGCHVQVCNIMRGTGAAGCPHHVSANQNYLVQTIGVNEHLQTARNGQIKFQTAIFDKPWLRVSRVRKVAGLTGPLHGYLRRCVVYR